MPNVAFELQSVKDGIEARRSAKLISRGVSLYVGYLIYQKYMCLAGEQKAATTTDVYSGGGPT